WRLASHISHLLPFQARIVVRVPVKYSVAERWPILRYTSRYHQTQTAEHQPPARNAAFVHFHLPSRSALSSSLASLRFLAKSITLVESDRFRETSKYTPVIMSIEPRGASDAQLRSPSKRNSKRWSRLSAATGA